MNDSQESELERRVDEVLFYVWDPFGFKGEPFARTEYRNYVDEVLICLQNAKSSDEVSDLLMDIVENRMGLVFRRKTTQTVGALLLRHKKTIDSEYS
jgi:hypothetical protein